MILLVGHYQDADARRAGEFAECLRRNVANDSIQHIRVLVEDDTGAQALRARGAPFDDPKVACLAHGRRLTYDTVFAMANRDFRGHQVIAANADICFDDTLSQAEPRNLAGLMWCLSRWDAQPDGTLALYEAPYSQDAWIFQPPLPAIDAAFPFGVPGCDNRLAYEAERAGLKVVNPSRSVRAVHLHASCVHRYTDVQRLVGPYRFVAPSFLEEASGDRLASSSAFASHRSLQARRLASSRARPIEALLRQQLGGPLPQALRAALHAAVAERVTAAPPDALPVAGVAFRETMGYRVARLAQGVSTHVNDPRPITSLPHPLAGLWFTQVVANHAAPVEIEFRSSGRLHVLSGRGWWGHAVAAAFLDEAGWRADFGSITTHTGTVFDAWTLVGEAGERLTVPTQVMLVAQDLQRLD